MNSNTQESGAGNPARQAVVHQTSGSLQFSTDDLLPEVSEFHSIEILQEASERAGWTIEYRQLERGRLKVSTVLEERAEFSFMREQSNRCLEVVGEPPAGMLTVLIPNLGTQLWANGHTIDDSGLILLAPGTDMQVETRLLADVVSMHVPESLFAAEASELSPYRQGLERGRATPIRARFEAVESLRQLILSSLRPMTGKTAETEFLSGLLTHLVSLISGSENVSRTKDCYCSSEHWQMLSRARDYIEQHLGEPMRMANICKYSGASLSTLERIFRRELQMTPSAYIVARRLNAVRQTIIGDKALDKRITQLALDYGFTHLGRFSLSYRALFGQTPSEARRAIVEGRFKPDSVG